MEKTIRVGIIGCGVIAPAHIESYRRLDGVQVAWACDLDKNRLHKIANDFGIDHVTTDYREMLSGDHVDAVSVCTDHASHAQITVDALRAGKHVICEKPLASTPEGVDRMVAEARAHPQLVTAGVLQHRFDALYRCLRERLAEGILGNFLMADLRMLCYRSPDYYRTDAWRGTWAHEGGSLMINQAIHFIDTLQWIAGGVEQLSASISNRTHQDTIETEDTAALSLKFRNGGLGSIVATSSSNVGWEPTLTLVGDEGVMEIRNGDLVRATFANAEIGERLQEEVAALKENEKVASAKSYYGPSHPSQIADFVDAIREGRKPYVTFEDAREPVDLVLSAYAAARSGRWEALPAE